MDRAFFPWELRIRDGRIAGGSQVDRAREDPEALAAPDFDTVTTRAWNGPAQRSSVGLEDDVTVSNDAKGATLRGRDDGVLAGRKGGFVAGDESWCRRIVTELDSKLKIARVDRAQVVEDDSSGPGGPRR